MIGAITIYFVKPPNNKKEKIINNVQKFITVRFKVKSNFILKKDILPKNIILEERKQIKVRDRLIDLFFKHQIALHYFQPLKPQQLLQVVIKDITIELEPLNDEIVTVEIKDLTVDFLFKILRIEKIFLEEIIQILNNNQEWDWRWENLKNYLEKNNLAKYYDILARIIWS